MTSAEMLARMQEIARAGFTVEDVVRSLRNIAAEGQIPLDPENIHAGPPVPDSLDAAWQEAEAALPEGWALTGLTRRRDYGWRATAGRERQPHEPFAPLVGDDAYFAEGLSETNDPAAALRALTETLREGRE